MKRKLYELIMSAHHNDQAAMNEIISIFSVQLKSYSHQLNGEDTLQDLKLFIIELVKKINLENFVVKTDEVIMSYISKSLKREKFKLVNKIIFYKKHNCHLPGTYDVPCTISAFDDIQLKYSLDYLTEEERFVIYCIYFYGYTVKMISLIRPLSIYKIYNIKARALRKIKKKTYAFIR
ncbi:hypothetical protein [Pectinatus frisingensis]|uniref:hypothetical protein n=1 Tax=Pectinatus frisingensis TaxID=865 RepID=UPI0018C4BC2D|nr:hypothetical protein [Pectinatus frisingensis]